MVNNDRSYFIDSISSYFPHYSSDTVEKLYRFYSLLVEYNDKYDLSRLKNRDDIILKHFVDSTIIAKYITLPDSLLDIGTGAGFPGIPLKIIDPELRLVLGEPRPMRVTFMNMVIETLGLDNTSVFGHKVNEKMHFNVQGVITRAFESAPETLKRCLNFLPENGKIILLKGPGVDQELDEIDTDTKAHYTLEDDIAYTLPESIHERRLVVYKKTSNHSRRFYLMSELEELTAGQAISSADNKRYKSLKKITTQSGMKKSGLTFVSGNKIIAELASAHPELCDTLVLFEEYEESNQEMIKIIDDFDKSKKLLLLKKSLFNELDLLSAKQPLLAARLPEISEFSESDIHGKALIIPFQDPINVGSVIRSAVAFGIEHIILTAHSCSPFHPKAIRSSGGTVFYANLIKGPELKEIITKYASSNVSLIALDSAGTQIDEFDFPDEFALLPGVEGPGVPDEVRKNAVSIPITEKVESLNAAVSASIVLFELRRQNKL